MGLHLQLLASKSPQVRGCRGKVQRKSHIYPCPAVLGWTWQRYTVRLDPAHKDSPQAGTKPQTIRGVIAGEELKLKFN